MKLSIGQLMDTCNHKDTELLDILVKYTVCFSQSYHGWNNLYSFNVSYSNRFSFQVNSRDLTNASHEETVKALNSAAEPIIVELARRSSASLKTETNNTKHNSTTMMTATTSTQTEPFVESCCCHQTLTFPAPPPLYR